MRPGALPVVTFWMGEQLSIFELASLLSVQRAGHELTLYGYDKPRELPAGVLWCDAAEILPRKELVCYRDTNPSLGSNLFRYKLQAAGRGLWLDTDVLLLAPITGDGTEIFGWQDRRQINGAVLYLPKDHVVLNELLAYTNDRHPVPPFFDEPSRSKLVAARTSGSPVHVSQLPWGVWGPLALTYFIKKHRLEHRAKPVEVFYPVGYRDCHKLVSARFSVEELIKESTLAVHMWNASLRSPSRIRPTATSGEVVIEKGSYFERFCARELDLGVPC